MTLKGGTLEQLLGTRYAAPYVQIFENVTHSTAGATALTAVIFVLMLFCTINSVRRDKAIRPVRQVFN
jgi:choline transport protein